MCCDCIFNRRAFNGLAAAGLAGGLGAASSLLASEPDGVRPPEWDPQLPMVVPGKALVVQPVLMYVVQDLQDDTMHAALVAQRRGAHRTLRIGFRGNPGGHPAEAH